MCLCDLHVKRVLSLELNPRDVVSSPARRHSDPVVRFTGLKLLDCSNNQLTCVPASLSEMTNLEQLYLRHNKLRLLPQLPATKLKVTVVTQSSRGLGGRGPSSKGILSLSFPIEWSIHVIVIYIGYNSGPSFYIHDVFSCGYLHIVYLIFLQINIIMPATYEI